jgi:tetratricopeptide (TPR) repeat protein
LNTFFYSDLSINFDLRMPLMGCMADTLRFQENIAMHYIYHLNPVRWKVRQEISNKNGRVNSLYNIANVFEEQNDFDHALEYHFRELEALEDIKDKEGIAFVYNNIAYIYEYQDDITNALEYYRKSLVIAEELNDENLVASVLNNIGIVYRKLGIQLNSSVIYDLNSSFMNKSIESLNRSLRIFTEINDVEGIATVCYNMGMVYQEKSDHSRADEYFNKSNDLRGKIHSKPA